MFTAAQYKRGDRLILFPCELHMQVFRVYKGFYIFLPNQSVHSIRYTFNPHKCCCVPSVIWCLKIDTKSFHYYPF